MVEVGVRCARYSVRGAKSEIGFGFGFEFEIRDSRFEIRD
jgi:hypothetical protein